MKHKRSTFALKALLSCVFAGCTSAALAGERHSVPSPEWVVLNRFPLPGSGGWDYLSYDPEQQHLYIARGNRVQVVDPKNGVLVGEISNTPGVHGVAMATGSDKAYASNGNDQSVTVFQPSTLKTLAKIQTPKGLKPDFIAYEASTKSVLAFNGQSNNVSVINTTTDQVVQTIALAGKPEAAAMNGQGEVFVNIEDKNVLQRIDLHQGRVTATWKLPTCDEPAGLAMDMQNHRLFVGCHNQVLLMVNAQNGQVLSQAAIGEDVDAVTFDPDTQLVFSANADSTFTLLHEDNDHQVSHRQTVVTPSHSKTMALNTQDHLAYLVSARFEAPRQGGGKSLPKPDSFEVLVLGAPPSMPTAKP